MWVRALGFVLLFGTLSVQAHVPAFGEAGSSPDRAFVVEDPEKSWVFYDELAHDEQHWFTFEMAAGTELYASLSLPPDETARPALWVLGPGFSGAGPDGTPADVGAEQATPKDDLAVEPFSPLAMRSVASWRDTVTETGTYYVVIEADEAARYSVAIGTQESFTVVEWAGIPVERIAIQQWGGVPWFFAVIGEIVGIVAAALFVRKAKPSAREGLGIVGAGAVAGTFLTTMLLGGIAAAWGGLSFAVVVPLLLALAALGLGRGAFRSVQREGPWWHGIGWAFGAIVLWAGLLIGPALLAVWSVWTWRTQRAART